jgi:carbamoyltransferase
MAAVMGISAHYHDAAAALVVDGRVVAAMQEERFSRVKNDAGLPRRAALACLSVAGLEPGALDRVVFYENPYARLERVLVALLRGFPSTWRQFPRALAGQLGSKVWVLDALSDLLDVPRERVGFADHHHSHAASAFYVSPFERAAVLTIDGVGEETSTGLWLGEGRELKALSTLAFPHSLGLLYAALTAYLGFEVNEGEYKVMGLAAHGRPSLREAFARLIHLHADGSFELALPYFAHFTDAELGFGPKLEALLGPRRPPGKPWDLEGSAEDRHYADVAATLQAVTEEALLGLARVARERTGADALCLAGGVALNAVANARLLRESGFSRVFVQPAAGDAGGALGAALLGALEAGDARPAPLSSAALGEAVSPAQAWELAQALGLTPRRVEDGPEAVAARLARGQVVAMVDGRFEWGPRALGQRSLLALPADAGMREHVNRVIKRREPFRPLAPAVLEGAAADLFDGAPNDMTPFMTTVCGIRPGREGALQAVRHVDGSARLQTVTEASSPALFHVLRAVERHTGTPAVLNTSLNGPGEPIVAGAGDALGFFLAHPVDAMLVGDLLFERGRA